MNTLRPWLLVAGLASSAALLGASAVPAAPKPSVPNPFAGRFKQVNERIDALFHHRNEAPPPPDARNNPFRVPGAAMPAARPGEPAPAPDPASNLTRLQESVSTLRVSGLFEIGGRSHLVINARPYKEGDVVQTQVQGEAVYLRVREISRRSVTLELGDAEMTLKF
jgi:hypothetical protein